MCGLRLERVTKESVRRWLQFTSVGTADSDCRDRCKFEEDDAAPARGRKTPAAGTTQPRILLASCLYPPNFTPLRSLPCPMCYFHKSDLSRYMSQSSYTGHDCAASYVMEKRQWFKVVSILVIASSWLGSCKTTHSLRSRPLQNLAITTITPPAILTIWVHPLLQSGSRKLPCSANLLSIDLAYAATQIAGNISPFNPLLTTLLFDRL